MHELLAIGTADAVAELVRTRRPYHNGGQMTGACTPLARRRSPAVSLHRTGSGGAEGPAQGRQRLQCNESIRAGDRGLTLTVNNPE